MTKGINKRALKQKALYWSTPTKDGFGSYTFASPIEIRCRWEHKQELFIDADGRESHSEAVVYVDRVLVVEGFLMLGDLDDLSSAANETPFDSGLSTYKIKALSSIPSFRNNDQVRKVWLGERRA